MTNENPTRFHSPADDPSNPYFLHPSEGPGLVLVSQPLTGDNYIAWSRAFSVAITIKNKAGFLDGSIKAPTDLSPAVQNAWIRHNNLVFSWIYNAISKDIQASVLYTTCAKDVWDELRTRFLQCNGPRKFQLRRDLVNLTQDDQTVTQYYTKMKALWDEMSQSRPICSCGLCSCGGIGKLGAYFESELVFNFLMGLSESFSNTRSQILMMEPLPPINRVFSIMIQEERQKNMSNSLTMPGNLLTMATRYDQNKRIGQNFKRKERPMCSHCNMPGHTVEQCFRLHGFPPGYKSKSKLQKTAVANQISSQQVQDSSQGNSQLPELFQSLSNSQCQQFVNFFTNQMQQNNNASMSSNDQTDGFIPENDWHG